MINIDSSKAIVFNKILVVADYDVVSIAIGLALKEISTFEIDYAKYYDEAYLKIKKGSLTMFLMIY